MKNHFFNNLIINSKIDPLYKSFILNSEIKITPSDGDRYNYFGKAIAMSNSKIAIGAPFDNDKGTDSGAVYVYDLDGSNEIKITASDGDRYNYFGKAIAISGSKIVISAAEDDKGTDSGAVYVYDLDGSNEIKITPSDRATDNYFGDSVAISDSKIVVGASFDNDKGSDSGAIYVYDLDGSNEIKITASDAAAGDYFGIAVAISDSKIVVSAIGNNDKGTDSGAVYVYDLDGSNEIKITASDGDRYNYFGGAIAMSNSKIVVGAHGDNDKGLGSGSIYVYDLDGSNEIKITASDGAKYDYFGKAVAISDSKIVVGANKDKESGTVYVYDLDGSNEIKITASDEAERDYFGYALAISDSKIAIGIIRDDKEMGSGSIYVYDINLNRNHDYYS